MTVMTGHFSGFMPRSSGRWRLWRQRRSEGVILQFFLFRQVWCEFISALNLGVNLLFNARALRPGEG
eukprot:5395375-Prymnesium_polylepis.1